MELYDNIIYTKNTLEEDIKIILGAQNVISSSGYFAKSLLTISDNIKNHYDITRYEKELVEYNLIRHADKDSILYYLIELMLEKRLINNISEEILLYDSIGHITIVKTKNELPHANQYSE